mmetsp:Transcript_13902/g.23737  ORF Transcript_13902/g.23737 Transcript_13902/m.23737 type:complete len:213 (+) Transcript_13902:584-1222(+)
MRPPFFKTRSLLTNASTYSINRVLSASTKTMSNGAYCIVGLVPNAISSIVASASLTRSISHPAMLSYVKDIESPSKSLASEPSPRSFDASSAPSSPIPKSAITCKCADATPNALLSLSKLNTKGPPPSRLPTPSAPEYFPAAAAPSKKQAVAYPVNVPISRMRPSRDNDANVVRRLPCIDPDTMCAPDGRNAAVFFSISRSKGAVSVECAEL